MDPGLPRLKEKIMRKIITALISGGAAVVAAVALTAAPSSASERGVNPKTLSDAGWACQYLVHAVHCIPPGVAGKIGTTPALPVLVFDTTDPQDPNAPLLGTEFNIRGDLFQGQPCPTDAPSQKYTYLPDLSPLLPDYYACHRFDSPL
jgi:hypothetical protein